MSQVHQGDRQAARERYREHIGGQAVAQLLQRHAMQKQHAWDGRRSLLNNRTLANCEP